VIKYRAVAEGLEREGHPVQTMSQSLKVVEEWAALIVKSDKVRVTIYVSEEHVLKVVPISNA
jgi:hypothetical protein